MLSIIDTGVANIRSLQATFDRLNQPWQLTADPQQIAESEKAVLPGVGAFASAVQTIDQLQLRQVIVDRIAADRPLLCICLGMQLLAASSEESPGVAGLGVIDKPITRFSNLVQVPQLGWNSVTPASSLPHSTVPAAIINKAPFTPGEAYFANSYRLNSAPDGWGYAETDYDGIFISSIWRGRTLACQFHPELSGTWGESLIKNWIGQP